MFFKRGPPVDFCQNQPILVQKKSKKRDFQKGSPYRFLNFSPIFWWKFFARLFRGNSLKKRGKKPLAKTCGFFGMRSKKEKCCSLWLVALERLDCTQWTWKRWKLTTQTCPSRKAQPMISLKSEKTYPMRTSFPSPFRWTRGQPYNIWRAKTSLNPRVERCLIYFLKTCSRPIKGSNSTMNTDTGINGRYSCSLYLKRAHEEHS